MQAKLCLYFCIKNYIRTWDEVLWTVKVPKTTMPYPLLTSTESRDRQGPLTKVY